MEFFIPCMILPDFFFPSLTKPGISLGILREVRVVLGKCEAQ